MEFITELEKQMIKSKMNEKSRTENGALAYSNAGSAFLDFNFHITAFRNGEEVEIRNAFADCYNENSLLAIKYLFYIGDIRGEASLGERRIFRICLKWLAEKHPSEVMEVLHLIPEYNRWDSLVYMANPEYIYNKEVREKALDIIYDQLYDDIRDRGENKPISLLAKWLPSENASSKETKAMAKYIQTNWHFTPRMYRKVLSNLRAYLDVVECKMSANNWDEVNYETVPSKANLNYNAAFLKHDEERRREFLGKVSKGESKINAKTLMPYEIVHKYGVRASRYFTGVKYNEYNESLELLWKGLPQYVLNNVLVVRDGSGSMTCGCGKVCPLDVATALAIYAAEHNKGVWKDKFITFSNRPKFIDLSDCSTLLDKLEKTYREDECSNTDIFATMKLILDVAVKNNLPQRDIPPILILSDMQFDGRWFNFSDTLFESIGKMYANWGYSLPKIIFWNLSEEYNKTIPLQQNELGLILISGFNTNLFNMVMSNEINPYKALTKVLNSARYEPVAEALCI